MTRGSTDHKPDGLDGVLSGEEGGDKTMAIAVVGMSCRLPGGATDPERLWQMCAEQRDVWQPIPKDRLNTAAFYHPDPGRNGTVGRTPFIINTYGFISDSVIVKCARRPFPQRGFSSL